MVLSVGRHWCIRWWNAVEAGRRRGACSTRESSTTLAANVNHIFMNRLSFSSCEVECVLVSPPSRTSAPFMVAELPPQASTATMLFSQLPLFYSMLY